MQSLMLEFKNGGRDMGILANPRDVVCSRLIEFSDTSIVWRYGYGGSFAKKEK